jgi:hypothetical protein
MYKIKTMKPVERKLPCHANKKNKGLAYAGDDWEYEKLQQVAFFLDQEERALTRTDIDSKWQVGAVEYIQARLKEDPVNGPRRTLHLFLEIQNCMGKLLQKLEEMGVVELV